ncbi:hypothetical protein AB1K91_05215 [Terribacillus sp. 179-K 1B1 HS]|uniref:hypothetical protein n=1 Tax=Terribacillus sp. 179-K 1B1 HS TaxID=3142388 RepID=UPI00399F01C6
MSKKDTYIAGVDFGKKNDKVFSTGLTKLIPVIAFKNKNKDNRYLAASMDAGDWSDEDLDVTLRDIGCAYLVWREDLSKPDQADIEQLLESSRKYKQFMKDNFGDDAMVSFDVDGWLEMYDPVKLEITEKQLQQAKEMGEL